MNPQTWREKINAKIKASSAILKTAAPDVLYGYLASCSLLPLVAVAAQQGNYGEIFIALSTIMGNAGAGLITNQIQSWHDRSDQELADELRQNAQSNPEWNQALNSLIESHQLLNEVKDILDSSHWTQLQQTLQDEFHVNIETSHAHITAEHIETINIQSAIFQAPPEPGQVDPQELLRTYLTRMMRQTGRLDLAGVDPKAVSDQDKTHLQLASVYTALDTVQSKGEHLARLDRESLESAKMERLSALAFINQAPYAALLGDPGSGKTTFTNFLALCLAGEALHQPLANLETLGEEWQLGPLLPVRVVLRHFGAALLQDSQSERAEPAADRLWHYITAALGPSLEQFGKLLNRHLLEEGGLLILDGLDEVPEANQLRQTVQQAVQDFRDSYPKVRILLTSRTYAYQRQGWRLPDFAETVLAPFSTEQIENFVDGWYDHIAQVRPSLTQSDARARAVLLKHAIQDNRHLRDLAPRPLLLTLMASLHAWRGGALPQDREQLYEESIELLLDIWQNSKRQLDEQGRPQWEDPSVQEWAKLPPGCVIQAFQELSYTVHREQDKLTGTADIDQKDLVQALQKAAQDLDLRPQRIIEYIQDRAGLLINRGPGIYSFPHRTFQEYLAARHLTDDNFPYTLLERVQEEPERWREVVLLAGAKVAKGTRSSGWDLASRLCHRPYEEQAQADDSYWWSTLLAGQILVETGLYHQPQHSEPKILQRIKAWLTALISNGHLPMVDRAQAGMILGTLGDERPGVGLLQNGLPDIDWITIDPGPFIMGSDDDDEEAHDHEKPQYICELIRQPYEISRYPVTVAQYRAFVTAGGYEQPSYWTEAGWVWREKRGYNGPRIFDNPAFQMPNHPQVGVSWYEALAFCNWLSEVKEFYITLPNEVEWERAARDTDGRRYPWGDTYAADHCNIEEAGIGHTSAVGIFPSGNAACGAADLAGNVWEWTRSQWGTDFSKPDFGYPYDPDDGREDLTGGDRNLRVIRGGSFYVNSGLARCAFRYWDFPYYRFNCYGFRCCCRRPH